MPPRTLREGPLTEEQLELVESAKVRIGDDELITYLCPPWGVPVVELFADLEVMLEDHDGPSLVVLDSLQRLAAGAPGDSQRLQVQHFTWFASSFAKANNVAVLLISEQSRTKEGKAPKAGDVLTAGAESRAVEFVTDILVGFVPDSEPDDEIAGDTSGKWERLVNMIVAKNRQGQIGRLPERLVFTGPCWDMRAERRPTDLEDEIAEMLSGCGSLAGAEIAKRLKRRKQTILATLRFMEQKGVICSEAASGENHGRSATWNLVPEQIVSGDRFPGRNSGEPLGTGAASSGKGNGNTEGSGSGNGNQLDMLDAVPGAPPVKGGPEPGTPERARD